MGEQTLTFHGDCASSIDQRFFNSRHVLFPDLAENAAHLVEEAKKWQAPTSPAGMEQ